MGMMLFRQNELQCRRVCDGVFFDLLTDWFSQIDMLVEIERERDDMIFVMMRTIDTMDTEMCWLSSNL